MVVWVILKDIRELLAKLERHSKYSRLGLLKKGCRVHEYLSLSAVAGVGRVAQSKTMPKDRSYDQLSKHDKNLLASEPLFVKVRIVHQLTRCQFDKMIVTLTIYELRKLSMHSKIQK